jgi:2-polyprenyl-6-methoxyphenol hydroxylase-like FAD-dependent oxidoreductase
MSCKGQIVVVGGRVSGLLTAALLADQGEKVVVLERGALGAPTVSISLICPDALAVFDKIGFGARLDAMDFTRISQLSFELLPGVRITGSFPRSFGRSWGYAIRRELLDTLLQRHVTTEYPNITWIDSFHVDALVQSNGRVCGVEGARRHGTRQRIEGDLVIGADGKFSTVAELTAAVVEETANIRTCFYYAYFKGAALSPATGTLCTYHGSQPFPLIAFSQEAENGLIGVGVQASQLRFAEFRKDPLGMLTRTTRLFPQLQDRLKDAELASKVFGMLVPVMHKRQAWGEGWALVGDAAVHINPITGQGISFAARAAAWLSEAVARWRCGEHERIAMSDYANHLSYEFRADFRRAALVADIEAPVEAWRTQCYAWMARQPHCVDAWLRMLTNAISIEEFELKSGLADAEEMFHPRSHT